MQQFFNSKHSSVVKFQGSKLRMSINGELTFKVMMCGGIPDGSKELRNSIRWLTAYFSFIKVSFDLYMINLPDSFKLI